jgi:FAD:protein FMN transferase
MGAWRALYFEFTAMASPCSLRIETRSERKAQLAAKAAIAEVHRIESKYSRYKNGSIVSRINAAAGAHVVSIDAETAHLLDFADHLWRISGGLFDATSGVLRQAWNFKTAVLPDPEKLRDTVARIGWEHVQFKGGQCHLDQAGMELDFGGFGKEYAVDRAVHVLQEHGVEHALLNLGGDIHALGSHGLPERQGQAWQVKIQHPRHEDALLAGLPLSSAGLATSGDYERYFEIDGYRYCHVLDPRTGWPVNDWQSITVLAPNTTTAGALSTIAMLKGAQALPWLDAQGVGYLAVRHDGEVQGNVAIN